MDVNLKRGPPLHKSLAAIAGIGILATMLLPVLNSTLAGSPGTAPTGVELPLRPALVTTHWSVVDCGEIVKGAVILLPLLLFS